MANTAAQNLSPYLDAFGERAGEPSWLNDQRRLAIERFSLLGFPTRHDEDYKYTPLASLAAEGFSTAGEPATISADDVARVDYAGDNAVRLVFLDGRFQEGLSSDLSSLPAGVEIATLRKVLAEAPDKLEGHLTRYADFESHATTALNTAFFEDGVCVSVADNVVAEAPVHIVWVSSAQEPGRVSYPRTLILAGRSAHVTVVESFIALGEARYWTNPVTEVVAEANSRVRHYKAQTENAAAVHTARYDVLQERDANTLEFSLSYGAKLARNDIRGKLNDEGGECSLDGLYVVSGEQHVDHHTVLDHSQPHCNSHQLYKGVLDGRSRGVFNGKIFVREGAMKTDAVQNNKNLLLSNEAEIETKPQLEIFNNDVRCTHGATVGQLDAEAMFYLLARGIGRAQARSLLTYAFAADALARIELEPLKKYFEAELMRALAADPEATL